MHPLPVRVELHHQGLRSPSSSSSVTTRTSTVGIGPTAGCRELRCTWWCASTLPVVTNSFSVSLRLAALSDACTVRTWER